MILKIITIGVGAYLVFVGIYYVLQRQMIYYPISGFGQPQQYGLKNTRVVLLKTADGLNLKAWYHPPPKKNVPTLLYLPGNAGNIINRVDRIRDYTQAGFGVLLVTWRGYSNNPGKPTEQGLYQDARAAMDFLEKEKTPSQCIVIFGESLGTGPGVQIASEMPVGGLILQSSFSSLADVAFSHYPFLPAKWLLKDRYESIKKIKKIKVPLLFLHGDKDNIVPLSLGRRLYQEANDPKEFIVYKGFGHNNLFVVKEVIAFLNKKISCQKNNSTH